METERAYLPWYKQSVQGLTLHAERLTRALQSTSEEGLCQVRTGCGEVSNRQEDIIVETLDCSIRLGNMGEEMQSQELFNRVLEFGRAQNLE